jgi:hypothetical protein
MIFENIGHFWSRRFAAYGENENQYIEVLLFE